MRLRFNSKGKWSQPTIHITGIRRDLLACILDDAKIQVLRELEEKPGGATTEYNTYMLVRITAMQEFLQDTFPGKVSEIPD